MIQCFSMSFALAARPPRFLGAVPVALLHDCLAAETVIAELRVGGRALEPVAPDVYSTLLDVPKGEWLLWPRLRSAMWVGARDDALPGAVRERVDRDTGVELPGAVDRLAGAGVWVREAAALIDGEWGRPARADGVLALLGDERLAALSGVFLDRAGEIARLHISAGGICWTDRPARAIQWLLKAYDLPMPS
jgi:hypothetical protein